LNTAQANSDFYYNLPISGIGSQPVVGDIASGSVSDTYQITTSTVLRDDLNDWVSANGGYGTPYAQWFIRAGINNGYPTF
jgi:hypothetical protein